MWTIDLTGNEWNVRQEDDESAPCRASVPGCVHMDLMREGRIEDPFYRDNETDLMWVGEKTWIYERTFMVDSALLRRTCILLQCEGLDTLATIEINGQTVGSANNMFRLWEYDIRDALREGENTIAVRFDSALSYGREQQSGDRYKWCGGAAHRLDGGNQVRKEQCNFGWDWGPMCVTCGIWRPIRVLAMDIVRLTDVQIHQYHAPSGDVELDVALTVDQVDRSVPLQAHVSVCYEGETVAKQSGLELTNGRGWVSLHIPDPHLWWPNGMGDQHLYTVWVELQDATGRDLDRAEKRVGLRTLELVQKLDQWGQSFYFAANGVPFYAKGANWIPGDVFQARMTDERYRYLLESARHANMNMLRVWGGGIYEEDAFYNMCDELGLCVWQDFMFACACYPAEDDTFMDNCREEFVQNVRRLRHHPSLAIWCGNNELEQMHVMNDDGSDGKMKWVDYSRLFDMLIPSVLRDEDPDRPYIPSSEHSPVGNREDSSNPNWGDAHLWSVWHGRQPFEWYRTTFHRFCSEFGFQSFPEPLTVDTYTLPKDRNITSPVMEHHQRSGIGNQTIIHYMLDWLRLPVGFHNILWASQILQGLAIKYAVEHWRRNMPRCMGAIYWQLNDCWQVASWASIDSLGRWKALHYMAKRFFARVLVSGVEKPEDGTVDIHLTSDEHRSFKGTLAVTVTDLQGNVLIEDKTDVSTPVNGTTCARTLDCADVIDAHGPDNILVWLEFLVDEKPLSSNLVTFVRPKAMHLERPTVATKLEKTDEYHYVVTLTTDKPALWAWLCTETVAIRCSDNYMCLAPWQEKRVEIILEHPLAEADLEKALCIRSIADLAGE